MKTRWADDTLQLNLALYRNELTYLTSEVAVTLDQWFGRWGQR